MGKYIICAILIVSIIYARSNIQETAKNLIYATFNSQTNVGNK